MERELRPLDDHRHLLAPNEHEAFFFAFSAPDGERFGILRLIFGRGGLLEVCTLRAKGRVWIHQFVGACPPAAERTPSAAGPNLTIACLEPWQRWRASFQGRLSAADGSGETLPLGLELEYRATTPAALYDLDTYHQAQQDGWLAGELQIEDERWQSEWLGYRDHSWGQRPSSGQAAGWTVATLPGRFYITVGETTPRPTHFGRFLNAEGVWTPLVAPQVQAGESGWKIHDRSAGLGVWTVKRPVPPLITYLGPAGRETAGVSPQADDWARDEFGPAIYSSPDGEQSIGFWEQGSALKR